MRVFVVDAFTDVAFAGNPAGVVLLEGAVDDAWLQAFAAELGFSETAYVTADRRLRWFTPAVEVDLCGHATLATAHVLAALGDPGPFSFATRSGELRARAGPDGITLDFPARAATPAPDVDVADALGVPVLGTYRAGDDVLVEVADESVVAGLRPDLAAVAAIPARGVTVTAVAGPARPYDFVSRFFAPRVGVPEDPVTGSAHCALAPFWSARLGRADLVGRQLSARGGTVATRVAGDRVLLRGRAVTVLSGDTPGP